MPAQDRHEDIVEWLVHHTAVGVGHFYMCVGASLYAHCISWFTLLRYDDHSDPPLRDLLEPWIQSNLVTYLKLSYNKKGKATHWQVKAYNHCAYMFSIVHEWLGFIDSDEFIYLTSPQHPSLHDLLVTEFDQYSGLAMNWVVYGSSDHVQRPNGALLIRVHLCMPTALHATGTVLHNYHNCMPHDYNHTDHDQIKVLMHAAYGQNMFEVKSPHNAKPMVRRCRARSERLLRFRKFFATYGAKLIPLQDMVQEIESFTQP